VFGLIIYGRAFARQGRVIKNRLDDLKAAVVTWHDAFGFLQAIKEFKNFFMVSRF
jgi:hypothetical protein